MTRFTSIALENWRNFVSVDIALQQRVFVVGANGSGKSNFLDAFRFLHDIAVDGLQPAVVRRGGVAAIRSWWTNAAGAIGVRASLQDDSAQDWRYELQFADDAHGQTVIRKETVCFDGDVILDHPNADDLDNAQRPSRTALEQATANEAFRFVARFFTSIRSYSTAPEHERGGLSLPSGNGRAGERSLIQRIAEAEPRVRSDRLRRISAAVRSAAPQLLEVTFAWDERGTPHLQGRFDDGTETGVWRTEETFSDGTLRLLGLLWAAIENDGPLLIEEPEQSVHPDVVRHMPGMLWSAAERQTLVSTYSRDFLLDEDIGLDEVFVLRPTRRGTAVQPSGDFPDVRILVQEGMPLGEVILPLSAPLGSHRLTLRAS